MKKTKILIPAMALLALSTAASVTGTVAWFQANTTVTATGLQMKSTLPSSLVIGYQYANVGTEQTVNFATATKKDYGATGEGATESMYGAVKSLAPATHVFTANSYGTVAVNDLAAVQNGQDVDPQTGIAGDDVTWKTAASGVNYVDYYAYIASAGADIIGGTLKASIEGYQKAADGDYDAPVTGTQKAASVDFFIDRSWSTSGGTSIGTWVGTLNLAKYDANLNNHTAKNPDEAVIIDNPTTPVTIPGRDSQKSIRITMRVYFDGNLKSADNQCFVYTNDVNANDLSIGVTFNLTVDTTSNG